MKEGTVVFTKGGEFTPSRQSPDTRVKGDTPKTRARFAQT